jgi:hypothetical protein
MKSFALPDVGYYLCKMILFRLWSKQAWLANIRLAGSWFQVDRCVFQDFNLRSAVILILPISPFSRSLLMESDDFCQDVKPTFRVFRP